MANLKVVELYEKANPEQINNFARKVDSNTRVMIDYDKIECDYEWINIIEDSIRYIDNILRNPNRFIINEEEIVKIELARRVTVESIKHLSRNTNLIQEFDTKTGDVKPSKILNINKEESYDTYENRFIYTLIQHLKAFLHQKKSQGVLESSCKNNKKIEYMASSSVGAEKVNATIILDSKSETRGNQDEDDENLIPRRLERIELQISDLCNSEVYKTLARKHVALVVPPIKKTNLILKNVNFQYAVKLWNYLQENIEDNTKEVKKKEDYVDKNEIKEYMDEAFLLDYLVLNSINNEAPIYNKDEVMERIIHSMVRRVIYLKGDMDIEGLKDVVGKHFEVIKYKDVTSDNAIYKKFKRIINRYIEKIDNIKI